MSQKAKAECPHCKGTNFYVHEFVYSKAATDDENQHIINVYENQGNGISLIECCNEACPGGVNGGLAEISEIEFLEGVEFNFQ